jgi:hypothetical protein
LTGDLRAFDHHGMKSAADIWICNVCRSINPISSNRCYRCHTPIQIAAAKPDELTVHQVPKDAHTEVVGTYRRTETLAALVTVAAVAFILATFLALFATYAVNDVRANEGREAADALFRQRLLLFIPAPVIGVLGLLVYAAWIRRVVDNLPPLVLAFSRNSPPMAVVEPLIPGFNLYATALIGLAWILVVGPALVLVYVAWFTRFLGTGAELARVTSIGAIAVFVLQAIALVLMLVALWQVEKLLRAKAAAMPAKAPAARESAAAEGAEAS